MTGGIIKLDDEGLEFRARGLGLGVKAGCPGA